jgi:hypothetical protein
MARLKKRQNKKAEDRQPEPRQCIRVIFGGYFW